VVSMLTTDRYGLLGFPKSRHTVYRPCFSAPRP
jgi:hypothetical protein